MSFMSSGRENLCFSGSCMKLIDGSSPALIVARRHSAYSRLAK